jgi:phosphatidylglycerophosphate synthase
MLSQFKSKFNKILLPLVSLISKAGIMPNHLTVLSLLLSLILFYTIISKKFLFSFPLILTISLLDALDGALSRYLKKESIFGAYLDTVVDRYVEFIILFSFLFINLPVVIYPSYIWITLAIFGSLITTYSKAALSEKSGKKIEAGFFERGERMLFLILIIFSGIFNLLYISYFLILFSILTNLSAIHRILLSLKLCMKD